MKLKWTYWLEAEDGQGLMEYMYIVTLIAVFLAIGILPTVGEWLRELYFFIGTHI